MSAPHHTLPDIPALEAYMRNDEQAHVNLDIEAYLRCEDLPAKAVPAVSAFAPDDITLMRSAHQMAARISALEAAEGPITAAEKRAHRVTGSALTFVIQQCSTRIREISESQYETLGQFRDLVSGFVVQRIIRSNSLELYAQMQGEYWTDHLQEGVLSCVEQLWEVCAVSGILYSGDDLESATRILGTMATIYTVTWFGSIDMESIDVMAIDHAVNRLVCHTDKLLNKQR